jgi:hypothetical protein
LITGDDLIRAGLFPGPRFAQVLAAVRAAQLENRIGTQPAALDLAKRLWRGDSER